MTDIRWSLSVLTVVFSRMTKRRTATPAEGGPVIWPSGLLFFILETAFSFQYFSWVCVHPMFYIGNIFFGIFPDICSLGNKPPDHSVLVFVCPTFPAAVWMAEICLCAWHLPVDAGFFKPGKIQEFTSVVACDCPERFPEETRPHFPLYPVKGGYDGCSLFIRDLPDDLFPGHPFGQD